jgi:CRISPR-associated protein Csm1
MGKENLSDLEQVVINSLLHHLEDDLLKRAWGDDVPPNKAAVVKTAKEMCDWERWQALIAKASLLACGRDEEKKGECPHMPLTSIFSSLSLKELKETEVYEQQIGVFMPQESDDLLSLTLSEKPVYPIIREQEKAFEERLERRHYEGLCIELLKELKELIDKRQLFMNSCVVLMMHYTSFIPHETLISPLPKIGLPDISLFDHLWLTAAFSSCLYNLAAQRHEGKVPTEVDWEREKGKYLLVVGDFSGVQDFLFSISSRGALKSLRARSFFLELLALHISELIVRKLNLSPLNVLYATGGRFTILAPYTEEASDFDGITGALPQIRREINDYLVNAHDARLYLVMKWFPYLEDRHFLHPEWLLRGMGDILGAIKIEKSRKYEYEHHEPRFRALLEPWEARASEPKLKKGTIWECIRCNGKYPRRYIKVSIPKR